MKKTLEEKQAEMLERQTAKPKAESTSEATRFQPGVSGNQNGRPKLRLEQIARAHADGIDAKDPKKRRRIERVLDELYASAVAHSVRSAEEYLSRCLGKPIQPIDQHVTITSPDEERKFLLEELKRITHGNPDSVQ
jgi:hypothetical protein